MALFLCSIDLQLKNTDCTSVVVGSDFNKTLNCVSQTVHDAFTPSPLDVN